MKKIDKKVLLTVVLGICSLAIMTSIINLIFGSISIISTDGIYALDLVSGLLLILPLVSYLLRYLDKECGLVKVIAPIVNAAVIVILVIFGITYIATSRSTSGAGLLVSALYVTINYLILDFEDLKDLFKSNKPKEVKKESESTIKVEEHKEEVKETKPEEIKSETKEDKVESTESK